MSWSPALLPLATPFSPPPHPAPGLTHRPGRPPSQTAGRTPALALEPSILTCHLFSFPGGPLKMDGVPQHGCLVLPRISHNPPLLFSLPVN
ncbi:unnamed protein product [Arctogadus glacialis]